MHMHQVSVVLGLLAAVIIVAEAARRTRLPYPTLMMLAGLLISLIPGLPPVRLEPELVFLVFLPPILYSAAWNTWLEDFRRHVAPISLLAVGLVLLTAIVVAQVTTWLIPGMSWWQGFLLGAIISPPDAAAATTVCRNLSVSRRIVTILEGESLVNDASGLIAFKVALIAVTLGDFSLGIASRNMLFAAIGGVAIGLIMGFFIARIHKVVKDPMVTTAFSLIAPYVAYFPAEAVHASGVLATVVAGLYVSRKSPEIFTPQSRIQAVNVWDLMILLINGALFLFVGLQLSDVLSGVKDNHNWGQLAWYALAVSLTVIIIRLIWVYPMARVIYWVSPRATRLPIPSFKMLTIVGWTGMRGIVSLAAAMSLPMFIDADKTVPFEHRDLILLLTFAVIFSTLVVQSLTLGPMIRFFGDEVRDVLEHEELITRMICANAALEALDKINPTPNPTQAETSDLIHPPQDSPELARIKGEYLDRMAQATREVLDEDQVAKTRGKGTSEDAIRRIAISAQRTALIALRNKGEVSEEVFRRIERDLDLEETLIDDR